MVHARAQKVAIKVIPAAAVDAERQLACWKWVSELVHANLLKILDYGKCDLDGAGYLFVVTEFAEEDLGDILPQRALNAEETRGMIAPVIEALTTLHQQGWIHTRVHPGNILAMGDQIKVSSDSISPKDEMPGIATKLEGFAAPEWGSVGATSAQDIWSLGASIVAAMTQKPPVFGDDGGLELPAGIPEPLAGIAREALKPEAGKRISIAGIRAKLNPASAPAIVANEAEKPAQKQPERITAKIDPVKVPRSPVAPPPVTSESRAPIPARPPIRTQAEPTKSYWMPVGAALFVVMIFSGLIKLYRQQSNAAAPPAAATRLSTTKPTAPSVVASSREPVTSSKRKAAAEPNSESIPYREAAGKADGPATKGDVMDQVLPEVSGKARGTIHGRVRVSVRIHVNAAGTVDTAELDTPSSSKYFAEQSIRAAKKWQFNAPEINGRSVASDWLLHFEITSTATNVTSRQVSP